MSAYFAAWVLVGFLAGSLRRVEPWRAATVAALLCVAAASRNLAWVFACFELAALLAGPARRRAMVPSVLGLLGLSLLLVGGGSADPSRLALTPATSVGVVAILVALFWRWAEAGKGDAWFFVPSGLALVAFLVRLVIYVPDVALSVAAVGGGCALLAGGVIAAWSESTHVYARGAAAWAVGFSLLALTTGARAVPESMLDIGAATAALVLLRVARTPWGVGVAAASLASIPPLPGLFGKLPVLAELGAAAIAVVLLGWVLLGVGTGREMARGIGSPTPAGPWARLATVGALVWALTTVVRFESLHALVVRASTLP